MCFIKTKESKLLIAKRDIIVYKVGIYADVQMFTPYFMTDYCYRRKALANQTVTFNKNYINIGLHSVLSLEGCYASLIGCIRFFSNGSRIPFIVVNVLCNHVYIGKFILSKDDVISIITLLAELRAQVKDIKDSKIRDEILNFMYANSDADDIAMFNNINNIRSNVKYLEFEI